MSACAPVGCSLPAEVLDALRRGQSVIPMNGIGDKKKPLVRWKLYQSEQTPLAQVERWQRQFRGKIGGWARITGKMAGVIVFDDDKAGWFERWELCPHVRTGSGGFHLLLQHPGWRVKTCNSKSGKRLHGALYPGLDIRADGGYSLICGFNAKGGYTWLRDPEPDPLDVLPRDVREFFGLLEPPRPPRKPERRVPSRIWDDGDRPSVSLLVSRAIEEARASGRNNGGFWLAQQLRDNQYSWVEATAAGGDYAARLWDTNTKGDPEPYGEGDFRATAAGVYSQAAREPWTRREQRRGLGGGPLPPLVRPCGVLPPPVARPRGIQPPPLQRPGDVR